MVAQTAPRRGRRSASAALPSLAAMKAITFGFHDVIEAGRPDLSGFPGHAAARYKLTWDDFERHLTAIADASPSKSTQVTEVLDAERPPRLPLYLTFDDGGESGTAIGELLAHRGWCGHFLILVDFIGQEAFLHEDDIRALRAMGHQIGSHSCSHPERMRACSDSRLFDEWSRSKRTLEEILDEPVIVASVPGGSFSPRVARAAGAAGLRVLFTSEPRLSATEIDGCLVFGRYRIVRTTTPRTSAGLASAAPFPRLRQYTAWNAKKAVKRLPGGAYGRLRRRVP
jgi:peptidoglycan/xylan/chitin deacetylase (PgdA/CDA1 family)